MVVEKPMFFQNHIDFLRDYIVYMSCQVFEEGCRMHPDMTALSGSKGIFEARKNPCLAFDVEKSFAGGDCCSMFEQKVKSYPHRRESLSYESQKKPAFVF